MQNKTRRVAEFIDLDDLSHDIRETPKTKHEKHRRRQAKEPFDIPEYIRQNYSEIISTGYNGKPTLNYEGISWHVRDLLKIVCFNGRIFVYDRQKGIYRPDNGDIGKLISEFADQSDIYGTNFKLLPVFNEVKFRLLAHSELEYPFNNCKDLIPVYNGVIRVTAHAIDLLPHSHEYRFTYRLPVRYDPSAPAEPIMEILSQWYDPDILLQIPAQALLQAQGHGPYKISYILEGEANAGKTSYCELLYRFFGQGNYSLEDLRSIIEGRFSHSGLEAKLINVHDDLEYFAVKHTGAFKRLTGSYPQKIERKFQASYTGKIHAVLVFSCNRPIKIHDIDDDAFWVRWYYLVFENSFRVDPNFKERAFTPENLSGYLNLVTGRIQEILRGDIRRQNPSEVREIWLSASDPVIEFYHLSFDENSDGYIRKNEVFASYQAFCKERGYAPVSNAVLGRELSKLGVRTTGQRRIAGKKGVHVFEGIEWSNTANRAEEGSGQVTL